MGFQRSLWKILYWVCLTSIDLERKRKKGHMMFYFSFSPAQYSNTIAWLEGLKAALLLMWIILWVLRQFKIKKLMSCLSHVILHTRAQRVCLVVAGLIIYAKCLMKICIISLFCWKRVALNGWRGVYQRRKPGNKTYSWLIQHFITPLLCYLYRESLIVVYVCWSKISNVSSRLSDITFNEDYLEFVLAQGVFSLLFPVFVGVWSWIFVSVQVLCATLHDVINFLVEKTAGVLIPLAFEEAYEKSICTCTNHQILTPCLL